MKSPKHIGLIASGVVCGIAVLSIGFLAVKSALTFGGLQSKLLTKESRWNQLNNQRPFPSAGNIAKLHDGLIQRGTAFTNLEAELCRNQFEAPAIEPAQFPLRLQTEIRKMGDNAVSNNVALPPQFAFGFDRYVRDLPTRENLPRLCRQLNWINEACTALFDAQVRDLVSVEREIFEEQTVKPAAGTPSLRDLAGGGASSGLGAMTPAVGYAEDPDGLFVKERIVLTFDARETSVWLALNAMLKLNSFNVIAAIEFANDSPKPARVQISAADASAMPPPVMVGGGGLEGGGGGRVAPPPFAGGIAAPPGMVSLGGTNMEAKAMTVDQRVIAGRTETVRVKMALDFYYFKKPESAETAKETKP